LEETLDELEGVLVVDLHEYEVVEHPLGEWNAVDLEGSGLWVYDSFDGHVDEW